MLVKRFIARKQEFFAGRLGGLPLPARMSLFVLLEKENAEG